MANERCGNALCADREFRLHLARLREELLTNFNGLLLDRIRFLEQTVNRLSSFAPTTTASKDTYTSSISVPTTAHRLSAPLSIRHNSSTTDYFISGLNDPTLKGNKTEVRSCSSSADLLSSKDRRTRFFWSKKLWQSRTRQSSEIQGNYLSMPMDAQWSTSTNDPVSNTNIGNEKGRLEARRFACDVDDNDVRTFKAMIYMEQARKQHARPLTRLRQALGIPTNSNTGTYTLNNTKKYSNG